MRKSGAILGAKLVSHNVGEFSRVKGLKVADWMKA